MPLHEIDSSPLEGPRLNRHAIFQGDVAWSTPCVHLPRQSLDGSSRSSQKARHEQTNNPITEASFFGHLAGFVGRRPLPYVPHLLASAKAVSLQMRGVSESGFPFGWPSHNTVDGESVVVKYGNHTTKFQASDRVRLIFVVGQVRSFDKKSSNRLRLTPSVASFSPDQQRSAWAMWKRRGSSKGTARQNSRSSARLVTFFVVVKYGAPTKRSSDPLVPTDSPAEWVSRIFLSKQNIFLSPETAF